MDREDLVLELVRDGILIDPQALDFALSSGMSPSQLKSIALKHGSRYIREEMLKATRAVLERRGRKKPEPPKRGDIEPRIDVVLDAKGAPKTSGDVEDFSALFMDRYRRLAPLVKKRIGWTYNIKEVRRRAGQDVRVIGMVSDVRITQNGFYKITLEDHTGEATVISRQEVLMGETVLNDEVIGVVGRVSRDGSAIFAEEFIWPDVEPITAPVRADEPVDAVVIADVHVGSREFLRDRFLKFIEWLKSDEARRVRYLVIAGDLVDGVGVYPGQEEELEITSVYEQYEALAEYLEGVPESVATVVIPGNHDFSRPHEPQPGFPEEVRKILPPGTVVLSNPSHVRLHGVGFLLYHGTSLNDMVEAIPGGDYSNVDRALIALLKRRHLVPIYGGKVPIAPLPRDYLVIEEVPQVFVTGHIHGYAYANWKGIHLINASTWQAQTAYQKMLNFQPDPGVVTIVHLDTLTVETKRF